MYKVRMRLFSRRPWLLRVTVSYPELDGYVSSGQDRKPHRHFKSVEQVIRTKTYADKPLADILDDALKIARAFHDPARKVEATGHLYKYKFAKAQSHSPVLTFKPLGKDDIDIQIIDKTEVQDWLDESASLDQATMAPEHTFEYYAQLVDEDPSHIWELLNGGGLSEESTSYALEALGYINSPLSMMTLMNSALLEDSLVIREGAILGLMNSDTQDTLKVLLIVLNSEPEPELQQMILEYFHEQGNEHV